MKTIVFFNYIFQLITIKNLITHFVPDNTLVKKNDFHLMIYIPHTDRTIYFLYPCFTPNETVGLSPTV